VVAALLYGLAKSEAVAMSRAPVAAPAE